MHYYLISGVGLEITFIFKDSEEFQWQTVYCVASILSCAKSIFGRYGDIYIVELVLTPAFHWFKKYNDLKPRVRVCQSHFELYLSPLIEKVFTIKLSQVLHLAQNNSQTAVQQDQRSFFE